jgi:hypothetical protein
MSSLDFTTGILKAVSEGRLTSEKALELIEHAKRDADMKQAQPVIPNQFTIGHAYGPSTNLAPAAAAIPTSQSPAAPIPAVVSIPHAPALATHQSPYLHATVNGGCSAQQHYTVIAPDHGIRVMAASLNHLSDTRQKSGGTALIAPTQSLDQQVNRPVGRTMADLVLLIDTFRGSFQRNARCDSELARVRWPDRTAPASDETLAVLQKALKLLNRNRITIRSRTEFLDFVTEGQKRAHVLSTKDGRSIDGAAYMELLQTLHERTDADIARATRRVNGVLKSLGRMAEQLPEPNVGGKRATRRADKTKGARVPKVTKKAPTQGAPAGVQVAMGKKDPTAPAGTAVSHAPPARASADMPAARPERADHRTTVTAPASDGDALLAEELSLSADLQDPLALPALDERAVLCEKIINRLKADESMLETAAETATSTPKPLRAAACKRLLQSRQLDRARIEAILNETNLAIADAADTARAAAQGTAMAAKIAKSSTSDAVIIIADDHVNGDVRELVMNMTELVALPYPELEPLSTPSPDADPVTIRSQLQANLLVLTGNCDKLSTFISTRPASSSPNARRLLLQELTHYKMSLCYTEVSILALELVSPSTPHLDPVGDQGAVHGVHEGSGNTSASSQAAPDLDGEPGAATGNLSQPNPAAHPGAAAGGDTPNGAGAGGGQTAVAAAAAAAVSSSVPAPAASAAVAAAPAVGRADGQSDIGGAGGVLTRTASARAAQVAGLAGAAAAAAAQSQPKH